METYLERVDLPDGQWVELLTRLTRDREVAIQKALEREQIVTANAARAAGTELLGSGRLYSGFADAVVRAHLWRASLRDTLTGELIDADGLGRADPVLVDRIETRALELYNEWRAAAYPKVASPTPPPTIPPPPPPPPMTTSAPASDDGS